jgi:hypothetical protein
MNFHHQDTKGAKAFAPMAHYSARSMMIVS